MDGGESGKGEAETCIEAGEKRVRDSLVGGNIRGQGGPMGCDNNDRSGREGCGQSEDVVFGDLGSEVSRLTIHRRSIYDQMADSHCKSRYGLPSPDRP